MSDDSKVIVPPEERKELIDQLVESQRRMVALVKPEDATLVNARQRILKYGTDEEKNELAIIDWSSAAIWDGDPDNGGHLLFELTDDEFLYLYKETCKVIPLHLRGTVFVEGKELLISQGLLCQTRKDMVLSGDIVMDLR